MSAPSQDAPATDPFAQPLPGPATGPNDPDVQDSKCAMCLGLWVTLNHAALSHAPCKHWGCTDCFEAALGVFKHCPLCRTPLTVAELLPGQSSARGPELPRNHAGDGKKRHLRVLQARRTPNSAVLSECVRARARLPCPRLAPGSPTCALACVREGRATSACSPGCVTRV